MRSYIARATSIRWVVQAQRFAARLARAPNAFFGELASDAAAARGGIDGEKAERGP